jgi:hypothetical protein
MRRLPVGYLNTGAEGNAGIMIAFADLSSAPCRAYNLQRCHANRLSKFD